MRLLQRKKSGASAIAESTQKSVEDAFDAVGADASFKVLTRDDKGRLQYLSTIHSDDISAGDVEEVLKDLYGGGRFSLIPISDDGKKVGKVFEVNIAGDSKIKTKRKGNDDGAVRNTSAVESVKKELEEAKHQIKQMQEKEREDRLISTLRSEIAQLRRSMEESRRPQVTDSILANLPQLVTVFSGLMGSRESAADMLEKISTIWRNIETSMPKPINPIEQVKDLADLIFDVVSKAQPPVVTANRPSSGNFLTGFLDQLASRLTGAWSGPVPAQATGLSGPAKQLEQQSASGFSGIPQPQPQQEKRTSTFNWQAFGIDPVSRIRRLIKERADVNHIADMVIATVDFIGAFSDADNPWVAYISGFLNDPGSGFDRIIPFMTELQELQVEDPVYLYELRRAIVTAAKEFMDEIRRQRQPGQGSSSGDEAAAQEKSELREQKKEAEHREPAEVGAQPSVG